MEARKVSVPLRELRHPNRPAWLRDLTFAISCRCQANLLRHPFPVQESQAAGVEAVLCQRGTIRQRRRSQRWTVFPENCTHSWATTHQACRWALMGPWESLAAREANSCQSLREGLRKRKDGRLLLVSSARLEAGPKLTTVYSKGMGTVSESGKEGQPGATSLGPSF